MSLSQFIRILWARRFVVIISTVVCFVVAGLIAVVLPPRYDATTRVMLDIVKPDPVTGQVIASQWARAYVKTQIELIRDYRVAEKVADAAGWTQSKAFDDAYRSSSDSKDMGKRRWLAQQVIGNTSARLVEGSNILEITYSNRSPETAAHLADLVRDAYVEQTLASRREAAGRNAKWFREQTAKVGGELKLAEQRKNDFERENGIVLMEDNVDADAARLQALANAAPVSAPATVSGGGGSASAGQLAQLDAAIASAASSLGPNHPDLQKLRQQRASVATSAGASRPVVVGGGPSLEALYNAQQRKVLQQAGKANEARRLGSDVTVLREQYQKTAARAAQLDQESESTESGLTLLGDASTPQNPSFPNVSLVLFGSLGFGLALGVLSALLSELLSRRVRGVEDLESAGVPVLGAMTSGETSPRGWRDWLGLRTQSQT